MTTLNLPILCKNHIAYMFVFQILGLDICADTMVGDELVRGISGGQRKRVTTGTELRIQYNQDIYLYIAITISHSENEYL